MAGPLDLNFGNYIETGGASDLEIDAREINSLKKEMCSECGSGNMYEGECMECGSMYEGDIQELDMRSDRLAKHSRCIEPRQEPR